MDCLGTPSGEAVEHRGQQATPSQALGSVPNGAAASVVLRRAMLPLNGVRVLACVWIMGTHFFQSRLHFGEGLNEALRRQPAAIQPILQGVKGLDVLFLLCGFFATATLVPALEGARGPLQQVVLRYYWRRAARIVPAFWVSLLLTWALVLCVREHPGTPEAAGALLHYPAGACPGGLWAQAAFLGHFQYGGGCGAHLWSQGTQAAFWAIMPVLLVVLQPKGAGFRRRVAICAGVAMLLSTAYRIWAAWRFSMRMPFPVFGTSDDREAVNFVKVKYYIHYSLLARAAGLTAGVLLALLCLESTRQASITKHADGTAGDGSAGKQSQGNCPGGRGAVVRLTRSVEIVALLGLLPSLWMLWKVVATPEFKPDNDPTWPPHTSWLHIVATIRGGVAASAALAVLLAVVMLQAAGPASRAVYDALAAPVWAPLLDLSYSAYLYHLQAHFWVWRCRLLPTGLVGSAHDLAGFAADAAASLLVTFSVAYLSYHLVERPATAAARRLEPTLFGTSSSGGGSSRGSKSSSKSSSSTSGTTNQGYYGSDAAWSMQHGMHTYRGAETSSQGVTFME